MSLSVGARPDLDVEPGRAGRLLEFPRRYPLVAVTLPPATGFRSGAFAGEAPQVFEDGGQARDFVHVADVARANLAAIDAVAASGTGSLAAYFSHPGMTGTSAFAGKICRAATPPPSSSTPRSPTRPRTPGSAPTTWAATC